MPELPEVQTVITDLIESGLICCKLTGIDVHDARIVAEPSPAQFRRRLSGKTISGIHRRGKYIIFGLSGKCHLLIHLRMSGHLYLVPKTSPRRVHDHIILHLDNGYKLRYHDPRKFGRFFLVDNPQKIVGKLGPEPLSDRFTGKKLTQMLSTRKRMLKPLLLDQTFIAGLGNIYTDEALWRARLHPCRNSATLAKMDIKRLYRAIRFVLRSGIKNKGTTLGRGETGFNSSTGKQGNNRNKLKVFRRVDLPCPHCRTIIRRIVVGQRSTFFCEKCQPLK
jgi:formamidopyrimidine-DNA glycosylase